MTKERELEIREKAKANSIKVRENVRNTFKTKENGIFIKKI